MKPAILKKRYLIPLCAVVLALIALAVVYFAVILPEKREEERRNEIFRGYYNAKLEQYARENAEYDDYEVDVAFIGDSLTDGYDLSTYYPAWSTRSEPIISAETSYRASWQHRNTRSTFQLQA